MPFDYGEFKKDVINELKVEEAIESLGQYAADVKKEIEEYLAESREDYEKAVVLVNQGKMSEQAFELFLKSTLLVVKLKLLRAFAHFEDTLMNFLLKALKVLCKTICIAICKFLPFDATSLCGLIL